MQNLAIAGFGDTSNQSCEHPKLYLRETLSHHVGQDLGAAIDDEGHVRERVFEADLLDDLHSGEAFERELRGHDLCGVAMGGRETNTQVDVMYVWFELRGHDLCGVESERQTNTKLSF